MRTLPVDFATRLGQEGGQRTRLCKIEREDGTIRYWCARSHKVSGTAALTDVAGNVYSGNIIEAVEPITYHGDGEVSATSLRVPLGADYVTESEFIRKLYQRAKVTILSRWTDGTAGEVTLFVGWIGAQDRDAYSARFELRSRIAQGKGVTLAEMSPGCRAQLFSTQWPFLCNVAAAAFTDTGTVATVTNIAVLTATFSSARDDGFYKFGKITWDTGVNAGVSTMVRAHTGAELKLFDNPLLPEVGDTFTVTAGCNKTRTQCIERFDNIINFQGEDYLPSRKQGFI